MGLPAEVAVVHQHEAELNVHEGHGEHHGHVDGKFYFKTWLWLLIITAVEVGLVAANPPRNLLIVALLVLTVLKAGIIVANFMHVRFERLNMLYVVITPFILVLVLFVGLVSDFARALGLR